MSDPVSWNDLRLVHAIVQSGSMVSAATDLGLNHSTIFRRLNALEKSLGVKLFERSRAGYEATQAGHDIAALAARMAQDVADLERSLAGRDGNPSGVLRITTNDTFVVHFLSPVLAAFSRAYPAITVDLIVSQQSLNLSRRDADIAVRATDEPPETLVGRRICAMPWSRYAPENMREVLDDDAPWIGFGERLAGIRANRWFETQVRGRRQAMRCDNLLGIAQSISAGVGVGILPCFIGDSTPGLRRFGELLDFNYSLWLLTHADLRTSARVRAFMDCAAQELLKYRPLIEGRRLAPDSPEKLAVAT